MDELTVADILAACDPVPATAAADDGTPFNDELAIAELMLRLRYAVGELARRTGKTPRTIFDEEFVSAPSDEWWRAAGISR